jgi:hypothetical protein
VVAREHVAYALHVVGHGPRFPAGSAEDEALARCTQRGRKEELLDTCFSVWQAAGHKAERAVEARIHGNRVVHLGVERIVDGDA